MVRAKSSKSSRPSSSLMVRLDKESKEMLVRAAALRKISLSDYVRLITVAQAEKEVRAAASPTISLSPEGQLRFWNALHATPKLTAAQKKLGAVMRGAD